MENSKIVEIYEKLYATKKIPELFQEIKDKKDEKSLYFLGRVFFLQGDINEALSYFEKAKNYCEAARCKIIKKDIWGAKQFLNKVVEESPLYEWLVFLTDLFEDRIYKLPSFFEVRNFLEVDLSLFLDFGNIDFSEKIINNSQYFVQANSESNKFFARVLYNYNFNSLAHIFLDKSFDIFYNDPETHFIKAQCYLVDNKKEEAKKHLDYCLNCEDNYFPAKKLLKEIN